MNAFSAAAVETRHEMMWMNLDDLRDGAPTAENGAILLRFSGPSLTGSNQEDCYTLEGFASTPDEIHTAYYYHYKRNRFDLKEVTRWS